ncbi:uncharacterized protein F4812DRAFT_189884 [Daldinia caldariorum]|uniref:uncharacterized protein n=1 Tax=Daldinia caldariorum TaxID=326644 RepID=UPI002008A51F|nr:uncharacterized protein F4812DRAFT_189884 [Daldinia caldariorum]KAI1471726.1 hypothetical protein F4812DRAFT_189884 [Daldinia caldariorum]
MSSPVPTPRQFLTSLIESLNSIPTPTTTPLQPSAVAANPLKLIPPAYRPLLTTLYAVYPLTLLPALDILDRRLATRIVVGPSHPQGGGEAALSGPSPSSSSSPSFSPSPSQTREEKRGQRQQHVFFIVRSAQLQHPRRESPASAFASGPRYVVRPAAWNCSCAAFAFAAFPRGEDREAGPYAVGPCSPCLGPAPAPAREGSDEDEPSGWQFGALSRDGADGSGIAGVPCCKHLLACVLAERWSAVLGGYVEEKVVGREEAAGLVAGV